MAKDNRELNQKLNDRRGGPNGVPSKVGQGRQQDAKHQGASKK
jgi:hypothetical protein